MKYIKPERINMINQPLELDDNTISLEILSYLQSPFAIPKVGNIYQHLYEKINHYCEDCSDSELKLFIEPSTLTKFVQNALNKLLSANKIQKITLVEDGNISVLYLSCNKEIVFHCDKGVGFSASNTNDHSVITFKQK